MYTKNDIIANAPFFDNFYITFFILIFFFIFHENSSTDSPVRVTQNDVRGKNNFRRVKACIPFHIVFEVTWPFFVAYKSEIVYARTHTSLVTSRERPAKLRFCILRLLYYLYDQLWNKNIFYEIYSRFIDIVFNMKKKEREQKYGKI